MKDKENIPNNKPVNSYNHAELLLTRGKVISTSLANEKLSDYVNTLSSKGDTPLSSYHVARLLHRDLASLQKQTVMSSGRYQLEQFIETVDAFHRSNLSWLPFITHMMAYFLNRGLGDKRLSYTPYLMLQPDSILAVAYLKAAYSMVGKQQRCAKFLAEIHAAYPWKGVNPLLDKHNFMHDEKQTRQLQKQTLKVFLEELSTTLSVSDLTELLCVHLSLISRYSNPKMPQKPPLIPQCEKTFKYLKEKLQDISADPLLAATKNMLLNKKPIGFAQNKKTKNKQVRWEDESKHSPKYSNPTIKKWKRDLNQFAMMHNYGSVPVIDIIAKENVDQIKDHLVTMSEIAHVKFAGLLNYFKHSNEWVIYFGNKNEIHEVFLPESLFKRLTELFINNEQLPSYEDLSQNQHNILLNIFKINKIEIPLPAHTVSETRQGRQIDGPIPDNGMYVEGGIIDQWVNSLSFEEDQNINIGRFLDSLSTRAMTKYLHQNKINNALTLESRQDKNMYVRNDTYDDFDEKYIINNSHNTLPSLAELTQRRNNKLKTKGPTI